jgi:hypothetical protein
MARDPMAQIDPLMSGLREQVRELLQRRGLLKTATQTLEAELELAALGRQFADEVMEKLLVSSVEELGDPTQRLPGAFPPSGRQDAICGAASDDGPPAGRTASRLQDELSAPFADAPSGAASGDRTTR